MDNLTKFAQKLESPLKEINLSNEQINEIPMELFEEPYLSKVKQIKVLNLEGNNLTHLPKELIMFESLYNLNLKNNKFSIIPHVVYKMEFLKTLYLDHNNIESISENIDYLRGLEYFSISYNKISSIPKELFNLGFIRYLNFSNNRISSLNKEIGELVFLRHLDITNTIIKKFPNNFEFLINLESLKISNYQIENVPIEILARGAKNIVNYFQSLKDQIEIFEAKLITVGEGGVGKTSLIKKIIFDGFQESELTTEGIEITKFHMNTQKTEKFRVNFWDFGGQEIYHSTHQFFLTKRSLYLLVWTARNDNHRFEYWLNTIKLLSDNAPIILILNKVDERIKMIDEYSFKLRFPNIISFHKVSAINGEGINNIINEIKNEIDILPHIGDKLPKVWMDIRLKLETHEEEYINYKDYIELCKSYNLTKEQASYLSQYFHDLGVFLHFQENQILNDIIFIKPEWATNAVYKLFDTKSIQKKYGKFSYEDLKEVWIEYPQEKFFHLIELMRKFELCFQIPDYQEYIIPDLLGVRQPNVNWDFNDNLNYEYHYIEFMPTGIITRFIVRVNDLIQKEFYWKNGVIIERGNAQALIKTDYSKKIIKIWINDLKKSSLGKKTKSRSNKKLSFDKSNLMEIIKRELDYIHKSLNNPEHIIRIPCICSECMEILEGKYYHDYSSLIKARNKGRDKTECKISFDDVKIDKLLQGFSFLGNDKNKSTTIKANKVLIESDSDTIITTTNTIIERVREVQYNPLLKIREDEFTYLQTQLLKLSTDDINALKEIIISPSKEKKNNLTKSLLEYGIAINQNISAAFIFEGLKYLLS